MAGELNKRITTIEQMVNIIAQKLYEMSKHTEEKPSTPHSKVGGESIIENGEFIFDLDTSIWKNYSIYKDDPDYPTYSLGVRG